LPRPEGCGRKKKPCAGRRSEAETERRARFSYDGLLSYLFVELPCRLDLLPGSSFLG